MVSQYTHITGSGGEIDLLDFSTIVEYLLHEFRKRGKKFKFGVTWKKVLISKRKRRGQQNSAKVKY